MAIANKLDEFGRPIDNPFFGVGGLGGALASLPGTPILGGGRPPSTGAPPDLTGTPPSTAPPGYGAGYTEPDDPYRINEGPGFPSRGSGGYEQPGAQGPLAGGPPNPWNNGGAGGTGGVPTAPPAPAGTENPTRNPNPWAPPPNPVAGVQQPGQGFWGDQNPWAQNVGASINDQPVSFASPGNPNTNYLTPEAAGKVGQTFGANVVEQNRSGMSSPGSGAPSQPLYGLDFGGGRDVQDAGMGAFQLARGDRPEDVAARYAAGLTTTGWGGPAPKLAENWDAPYWNRSNPVSTYDPQQSSPDQAQLIAWLRGQIGGG